MAFSPRQVRSLLIVEGRKIQTCFTGDKLPRTFRRQLNFHLIVFCPFQGEAAPKMDEDLLEHSDTVFIGAVDYNMTEEEFIEEVKTWGNIVKWYYKGPTSGWGTATFISSKERNDFLAKKR